MNMDVNQVLDTVGVHLKNNVLHLQRGLKNDAPHLQPKRQQKVIVMIRKVLSKVYFYQQLCYLYQLCFNSASNCRVEEVSICYFNLLFLRAQKF